jgi:hypothetical protein
MCSRTPVCLAACISYIVGMLIVELDIIILHCTICGPYKDVQKEAMKFLSSSTRSDEENRGFTSHLPPKMFLYQKVFGCHTSVSWKRPSYRFLSVTSLEVLLDVVGSGCGALRCRMRELLTSYKTAPHNRYQPHPAEPAQYTVCSNTRSLFSWRLA